MTKTVAIGTMNFGRLTEEAEARRILDRAMTHGLTTISTADTDYSGRSESVVASYFGSSLRSSDVRLFVEISGPELRVPHDPDLRPKALQRAVQRSLKRLRVEGVERVIVPRPSFNIPLEETLVGIDRLILRTGLARSYAISTFPAWLHCHAQHVARTLSVPPPTSEILPYNLLDRRAENEMLPNCEYWGTEAYAWAPLAQGLLAGRYPPEGSLPETSRAVKLGGIYAERVTERARFASAQFVQVARAYDLDPAAAAVAWVISHPGVSGALAGPRTADHVDSLAAALLVRLPKPMLKRLDEISPPGGHLANFFNSAPWMKEQS